MELFIETLELISLLNILGLFFILFRPDRKIILKDLKNLFYGKPIRIWIYSLFLAFFFLLPFSIPFSIMQIMNKDGNDH